MNNITIDDCELFDIPIGYTSPEQTYLNFLRRKGVPLDGVVLLRLKAGLIYHVYRCAMSMKTKISWEKECQRLTT